MKKTKVQLNKLSLSKETVSSLQAYNLTGGGDTDDTKPPSGNAFSFCLCPGASEVTRCGCVPGPALSVMVLVTKCVTSN